MRLLLSLYLSLSLSFLSHGVSISRKYYRRAFGAVSPAAAANDKCVDAASSVQLSIVTEEDKQEAEKTKLKEIIQSHPLVNMMDMSTDFADALLSDEDNAAVDPNVIESLDICCFGSPQCVEDYILALDTANDVLNLPQDERRQIVGNGNVLAACIGSETARVVLETGRWHSNNIYYPRGDDDVQGWADSVAQAAADLVERRFWE